MSKKEQVIDLMKHVYNEEPTEFKSKFNNIVKERIGERIEDMRDKVASDYNEKTEEKEDKENEEDTE